MENVKRFYLSDTEKKIAGVCGGLAEYFAIDVVFIRILFLLLTGFGLIMYILFWIIAPRKR